MLISSYRLAVRGYPVTALGYPVAALDYAVARCVDLWLPRSRSGLCRGSIMARCAGYVTLSGG